MFLAMGDLVPSLVASVALGAACAMLSPIIVTRQWAFIGEGIAHAAFGGAGLAWVLALAVPALAEPGPVYALAVAFCLATALCIGRLARRGVPADTAIGIFLAASLAWGLLAQAIHQHVYGMPPPGWEAYLVGTLSSVSWMHALAAAMFAGGVVLCILLLGRQILAYCFDPGLAEVSGVPVKLVHSSLMGLIAITIVLTMRMMGPLLVTALLVLPGATALQISRRLRTVVLISLATAGLSAAVGPLAHAAWRLLPPGPAVSLVLLVFFGLAYAMRRFNRRLG